MNVQLEEACKKKKKNLLFFSTSALLKKLDLAEFLGVLIDHKKENGSRGQRINNLHYNSTEAKEDLCVLLLIKLRYMFLSLLIKRL